tara:strand:- start:4638 stop:5150 length:513 start_codon:yes stop_codon:yes gene_type:complete
MSYIPKDIWKTTNVELGDSLVFTYTGLQEKLFGISGLGFSKEEVQEEIESNLSITYPNVFKLLDIQFIDTINNRYNLIVTVQVIGSPNNDSVYKAAPFVVPVALWWIITAIVGGSLIGIYVGSKLESVEKLAASVTEVGKTESGSINFGGLIPVALALAAVGFLIAKVKM